MPFEKRRRGSGSFGEDASVEQWRSSRNEMDVMPGGEDLINNMASAPFEGQSSFPEGPEQMMPEADGIDKVMEDEFGLSQGGRPSSLGGAPLLTHVDEPVEPAAKQAARKSKRKMLLDRELQITTESMKHQLADSSATVRDLTVGNYAAAEHGHTGNSLLALPSLPHVSPEILELSVLMMHEKEPAIKKARRDESAPEEQPAAGAPFADEPQQSPPMGDGIGRPSDAHTRGSHGADGMPPTPGFLDEMDVPEQRQSTEQVPSFQASHVLPEVDGNALGEKEARAGQVENDPVSGARSPPRDPGASGSCADPVVCAAGLVEHAHAEDVRHAQRCVRRVRRHGTQLRRYDREDQEQAEAPRGGGVLPGAPLPHHPRADGARAAQAVGRHRRHQDRDVRPGHQGIVPRPVPVAHARASARAGLCGALEAVAEGMYYGWHDVGMISISAVRTDRHAQPAARDSRRRGQGPTLGCRRRHASCCPAPPSPVPCHHLH